ncbi:hypothetical protein C8R44DRAFT_654481 [Mycena epipterygia]|nr:hypothetical protein C8R44DRAFT_654481 [Mycena epipterygia]
MKALSTHPLDDDIIDRVLTFLPDFKTLQAAILCSKSLYSVFATHPHSIVEAVAFNLIGPALLSAMNVIRNNSPVATVDDWWVIGHADPETTEVGVLTPEDTRKLSKNAVVVNTFQDIFSFRHKDRRSESSKLSLEESLRFTRALYRIMLFANVFPSKFTPYIDDADTEEEEQIRVARKEFFAMFSSPELCEIYVAGNFIEALGEWLILNVRKQFSGSCGLSSFNHLAR